MPANQFGIDVPELQRNALANQQSALQIGAMQRQADTANAFASAGPDLLSNDPTKQQNALGVIAQHDPGAALDYSAHIAQLNSEQRAAAKEQADEFSQAAGSVLALPDDQILQGAAEAAAQAKAKGVDTSGFERILQTGDPKQIRAAAGQIQLQAMTVSQQLDQAGKAATQGETARHNKADEAQAAVNAQNTSAYQQGELNKPIAVQQGSTLVNPQTGAPVGGGAAAPGPNLTGDAFLQTLPPAQANEVKALAEGRMAFPTGFSMSRLQPLIQQVSQYDPSFDATNYTARAAARKDMLGGGKSYQQLNNANTAIQHLGHLYDQIGDVSGAQIPIVGNAYNTIANAAAKASGTPGVPAYNDTLGHLAEETTRFYRQSGGAESDVTRNMATLSPDLSTAQKKAGVANTIDLIYGKLVPMADLYNKAMNTNFPPEHFLSPAAKATIERVAKGVGYQLIGGADPATASQQGAQAAPQQGKFVEGQTYTDAQGNKAKFQGGQFVPVP